MKKVFQTTFSIAATRVVARSERTLASGPELAPLRGHSAQGDFEGGRRRYVHDRPLHRRSHQRRKRRDGFLCSLGILLHLFSSWSMGPSIRCSVVIYGSLGTCSESAPGALGRVNTISSNRKENPAIRKRFSVTTSMRCKSNIGILEQRIKP